MPNHRKTSFHLTDDQARNQLGAHGHAKALGVPLNTWVTFLLAERYKRLTPQKCVRKLTKNYSDFARHNGFEPAWTSVLENGEVKGVHAHLCFHVPDGLGSKFSTACKRWAKSLVPDYKARGKGELTLKTKRVAKQALRCAAPNGSTYVETHYDTKNILAYCLKGLAPDSELTHLLSDTSLTAKRGNWKPEYQGAIEGLRCRVSDNIGWAARARHDGEVIPFPDLEGLHPLPANFGLSALPN